MGRRMIWIWIGLLFFGTVCAGETVTAWRLFFSYKSGEVVYLGAQRDEVPPEYLKSEGDWRSEFFDRDGLQLCRCEFPDPRQVLHFDGVTADGQMTGGRQVMDDLDAPFSVYLPFSMDICRVDFSKLERGNPQSQVEMEREDRYIAVTSCEIDLNKRYVDPQR